MRLECFKELLKDFLLSLLASAYVWVLPSIVALPDIIDVDVTIFVEVEFFEDALDQVLPERAHVTLDGMKQLVERDETIIVLIKELEKLTALLLAELESEVAETLPEFLNF